MGSTKFDWDDWEKRLKNPLCSPGSLKKTRQLNSAVEEKILGAIPAFYTHNNALLFITGLVILLELTHTDAQSLRVLIAAFSVYWTLKS